MHFHGYVRTMDFRFRMHVYMVILIWCYLFVVVVVGKWGMSGTLPKSNECHNVHRIRLFVLIHVIKNDEAVLLIK